MNAISANDTGLPAKPVDPWENQITNGMALRCDRVHTEDLKRVEELRARQESYLASLPVEPEAVIDATLNEMNPHGESYPAGFEEALHLSHALRPMVEHLQTDDFGPDRDALLWIADRIMFGLEGTAMKFEHMSNILRGPHRAKVSKSRSTP